TAPLPLEALFLIKSLAHWVTTGVPLVLAVPVLAALLGLSDPSTLTLTLFIGTPALSLIGAFGGALTIGVKRGGLLLSLLVLPLYIPTLVFGADAARWAAMGLSPEIPLIFLLTLTLCAVALFPFAGAAVLRMTLR
ncbi:MAG: heme exporter protein CcmB, partial [Pseudomonadota bacterium]